MTPASTNPIAQRRELGVLLLVLAALLPVLANLRGAPGPREIVLDFGPGDGPYTRGFAVPNPESFDPYEIAGGITTHWTTHAAQVVLPLEVEAAAVLLRIRFVRHLADKGFVDLRLSGKGGERIAVQRGFHEYETRFALGGRGPLSLDLRVDARDDRNLGLSMDWVRFTVPAGGRVRLSGGGLRPSVTLVLVAAILLGAGLSARSTLLLVLPLGLALAAGVLRDPWLTVRVLRGLPEALLLLVLPTAGLIRWGSRASEPTPTPRLAIALLVFVFLFRAGALNHPSFYNPDLRIHAGLVRVVREAGFDLLRAPAGWLYTPRDARKQEGPAVRATSGLWLRSLGGVSFGLPYSLAPHALLAPLPLDYDGLLTALKLLGAFASALPAALLVFLAPRVGAPAWAGALLGFAPTAGAELCLGAVPAVFGHAADVAFLLFVAVRWRTMGTRSSVLRTGLLVAVVELAYVSSALLVPLLAAGLGLSLAWERTPDARLRVRGLVGAVALGSWLALLLYYRDFIPGSLTAFRLLGSGGGEPLADPGGHRVVSALLAWGLPVLPLLALAGAVLLVREGVSGGLVPVVSAWALTAIVLGALQWRYPGVFGFLHLPLFVTPLLSLGAARALQAIASGGRAAFVLAVLLAAGLGLQGAWLQARSMSAELVLAP